MTLSVDHYLTAAFIRFVSTARTLCEGKNAVADYNPIYAAVGSYPAQVDDDIWVRVVAHLIKKEGSEQFLVNMLYVLRQSLGTGIGESKDHEDD